MNDLQLIGPKRAGLFDQYVTMVWKFLSKRFGMHGEAFQVVHSYSGKNESDVARKAKASGRKMHRRLEGKNGWLWYTIFGQKGKIHRLEEDMVLNHIRVPVSPTLLEKLVLEKVLGYKYPVKEPYESRWED